MFAALFCLPSVEVGTLPRAERSKAEYVKHTGVKQGSRPNRALRAFHRKAIADGRKADHEEGSRAGPEKKSSFRALSRS